MSIGSLKNVIYKMGLQIKYIAQSAGAVEYTDCTSAEMQAPSQWVSWIWQ